MTAAPVLEMVGVSKAFGSTAALSDVGLEVRGGEVHALLGENGAGKSTLMKILAGACMPDAGTMLLSGARYAPRHPAAGLRAGIAMIYQELNLAPHLTVTQNLMLGRELSRWGVERRSAMATRAREALELLAHPELAPDRKVGELGPGARQLVEIARALTHRARILVMDEPTSSLGVHDVRHLFDVIRRLAADGISVIYISHFLEEVWEIAERYTVLRDGRRVGAGEIACASPRQMVELMAGRDVGDMYPRRARRLGEVVLQLAGVAGESLPGPTDLQLHRGEIVGLAGLSGAGRTELLRAVFGLDAMRAGTVTVAETTDRGAAPVRRLRQGIGMLSEDRVLEGLAQNRGVAENLTLSRMDAFVRFGWMSLSRRDAIARRWIEKLGVRARGPRQPVSTLSGGNQQKIALARLLHHEASVLLLDEPTRGIDVASRAEIYRLICDLADRGVAMLLVSSYIPELLGLCDRVAVMHRGVLGPAQSVDRWTEERVLAVATGGDVDG